MDIPEEIQVQPLRRKFLDEVILIHMAGLGYTLNSRLGTRHLAYLYEKMGDDEECYVGVALLDGRPVGVVSGTEDAAVLKSRLLRSMSIARAAGTGVRLLSQPWLVIQWVKEAIIAAPVIYEGHEVKAVLTTIAVHADLQSRGVGRRLVHALEQFFARRHVVRYRLDTLTRNSGARAFYTALGFAEVAKRADSYVFVKRVGG